MGAFSACAESIASFMNVWTTMKLPQSLRVW